MQEEQGQVPVESSDVTKSVTERSNGTESCIGGAIVGGAEKAGWKADSVQ